jgi:phenylpropionate dioxygenase-like ring-hydroxylating dioxygenase large terminal subunit
MTPKFPAGVDVQVVAKQLLAHIDSKTTDCADAPMEFDTRSYYDPETAELERRLIFTRVPLIGAHSSELPNTHDFVRTQLPNNEVLLVRQPDGSVRGLVNVCRHRGARLVEQPSGNNRVFSCRYHGWAYNADGALRGISHANTFGDVDLNCLGLISVPVEERHGFVWVVDDPEGTIDVAEWLGPDLDSSLASMELEKYVCYRSDVFDEPVNWKAQVDGQVDTYHISFLHAKTVAPFFVNNIQVWEPLGRHGRKFSARRTLVKHREAVESGERSPEKYMSLSHLVLPAIQILRQPDHFQLLTVLPDPHDAQRSTMQLRLLVDKLPENDEERERWDLNWQILMDAIRDEDIAVNRELQHAVRNRNTPKMVLGRNEIVNQVFHKWYESAMSGDPAAFGPYRGDPGPAGE